MRVLATIRGMLEELLAPPPMDLSQLPMRVLATIRGMLSGLVQPQPSTAMATWARGIESSLTLTSLPVYLQCWSMGISAGQSVPILAKYFSAIEQSSAWLTPPAPASTILGPL